MRIKLHMARMSATLCLAMAFATMQAQVRETIAILGDSYSTYEEYLTPDTNHIWYYKKTDRKNTDVENVRQT